MTEQQMLIPMAPGERLRKLREQRRWTTASTAKALKIPADVLEAIEAGQLERFAPVYRKGYLRTYAQHLGLSEQDIRAMLNEIEEQQPELRPVFNRPLRRSAGDRWFRAGSYALASLLIGTLAWQLTHEAVRLSQGDGQHAAQTPSSSVAERDGQERPAAPSRHVNASIAALEALGRTRAGSTEDPGQAAWEALRAIESDGDAESEDSGLHHLRLQASGDSWVEIIDANGEQLEMDLVRGGTAREYQGQAPFRLLFGRASAVDLYLDGRQVELTRFISGDVLRMSLDGALSDGPPAAGGGDDG